MAEPGTRTVRVAAAGDLHCHEGLRDRTRRAFADLEGRADLVLLAGDLTTHGEPEQAAVLADACREVDLDVLAVLGNHDWHADRALEVAAVLEEAERAGGTIRRPANVMDWGGTSGAFADPEGYVWEIAYNPGWTIADDGSVTLAGEPEAHADGG